MLSDACLIHTNGENEPHGKNGGELVMGARESAPLLIVIAVNRVDLTELLCLMRYQTVEVNASLQKL